jgi:Sulfotransferase family
MKAKARSFVALDPERLPVLFVCGLHRSGTSALARLLAGSPGIRPMRGTGAPEDEGQHVQSVYPPGFVHGGPGLFAFDPGSHLTERSALASRINACALLRAWAPYWQLSMADQRKLGYGPTGLVVLEKSPPNLVRTRLLQELFPFAHFITLLRHPAVVTVSTARWRPGLAPATLLRHWLHAHRVYRADRRQLRAAHEVRYEDLLSDPHGTLVTLAAKANIDGRFDLGQMEAGHNDRHLQTWMMIADTICHEDRSSIERQVRRYGYSLQAPYVLPFGGFAEA